MTQVLSPLSQTTTCTPHRWYLGYHRLWLLRLSVLIAQCDLCFIACFLTILCVPGEQGLSNS
jgi:hypothetical protein